MQPRRPTALYALTLGLLLLMYLASAETAASAPPAYHQVAPAQRHFDWLPVIGHGVAPTPITEAYSDRIVNGT